MTTRAKRCRFGIMKSAAWERLVLLDPPWCACASAVRGVVRGVGVSLFDF